MISSLSKLFLRVDGYRSKAYKEEIVFYTPGYEGIYLHTKIYADDRKKSRHREATQESWE